MIEYTSSSGNKALESTFTRQVKELSGVDFNRCYQCLTCTLSCPVFSVMDYLPHQILRMIQLGAKLEILQSSTIWRCASCETCVTRCPNEVDIPRLMDILCQMALHEGILGEETAIPAFHRTFLKSIRQRGRVYELGIAIELKTRGRDFFSDIGTGTRMLFKRKLSLLPHRIKGYRDIKAIFGRAEEEKD